MANSKFGYVRSFEHDDKLPPDEFIVVGIRQLAPVLLSQQSFSQRDRYTSLMEACAADLMDECKELSFSYGHYDTYHFVFGKEVVTHQRRSFKLLTYLTSYFTAVMVRKWKEYFKFLLPTIPIFEGSIYLFPNDQALRDYITMHQMQSHHFNLSQTYSLAFSEAIARKTIESMKRYRQDTKSTGPLPLLDEQDLRPVQVLPAAKSTKNELEGASEDSSEFSEKYYNEKLYSEYGINYNNEADVHKKGTTLIRKKVAVVAKTPMDDTVLKTVSEVIKCHPKFKQDKVWKDELGFKEGTKHRVKFEMIPRYKVSQKLMPHAWIVMRLDGKGFHKFAKEHNFSKPNDVRALNLMNAAAKEVMKMMPEISFSYGESDEYSFVIDRYSRIERYPCTLITRCVSVFTSAFVLLWNTYFANEPLKCTPSFDGRTVVYPTVTSLRDYFSWRQADCHINNMYNTTFWELIKQTGCTNREAEKKLQRTLAKDKRNILSGLGVEYDKIHAMLRKGSIMYRLDKTKIIAVKRKRKRTTHKKRVVKSMLFKKVTEVKDDVVCLTGTDVENEIEVNLWWSSECNTAMEFRSEAKANYSKNPTPYHFREMIRIESQVHKIIQNIKKRYLHKVRKMNAASAVNSEDAPASVDVDRTNSCQDCPENINQVTNMTEGIQMVVVEYGKQDEGNQEIKVLHPQEIGSSVSSAHPELDDEVVNNPKYVSSVTEKLIKNECPSSFSYSSHIEINKTDELINNEATPLSSSADAKVDEKNTESVLKKRASFSPGLVEEFSMAIEDKKPDDSDSIDKTTTDRTQTKKIRSNPLWWTSECKQAVTSRSKAKQQFKNHTSMENFQKLKACQLEFRNEIKKAKQEYTVAPEVRAPVRILKRCEFISGDPTVSATNTETGQVDRTVTTLQEMDLNGKTLQEVDEAVKALQKINYGGKTLFPEMDETNDAVLEAGVGNENFNRNCATFVNQATNSSIATTLPSLDSSASPTISARIASHSNPAFIDCLSQKLAEEKEGFPREEEEGEEEEEEEGEDEGFPREEDMIISNDGIILCHVDIISDLFWEKNAYILGKQRNVLLFNEDNR